VANKRNIPKQDDNARDEPVADPTQQAVPTPIVVDKSGGAGNSAAMRAVGGAKRAAARIEDAIGGGVSRIGGGIESLGEGINQLGGKVDSVPLIGAGVKEFGGGLAELGESLTNLPKVAKSVRGRILFRSMLVGFVLVAAWIIAIVAIQLRGGSKPDFRPLADRILKDIRDGKAAQVFADSSPRMQEVTKEEAFIDNMADMNRTLGSFLEIIAVNDTLVTEGPSGPIGRVAMTLEFEKAKAKGSVSFQKIDNRWRLLGVAVEVPTTLPITLQDKKDRVKVPPEIAPLGKEILQEFSAGNDQKLWDGSTELFRARSTQSDFVALQSSRRTALGRYMRVLDITNDENLSTDKLSASFVGLVQFERGNITVTVGFARGRKDLPWKLNAIKMVLPPPRAGIDNP
jgi:hypothetical protein